MPSPLLGMVWNPLPSRASAGQPCARHEVWNPCLLEHLLANPLLGMIWNPCLLELLLALNQGPEGLQQHSSCSPGKLGKIISLLPLPGMWGFGAHLISLFPIPPHILGISGLE